MRSFKVWCLMMSGQVWWCPAGSGEVWCLGGPCLAVVIWSVEAVLDTADTVTTVLITLALVAVMDPPHARSPSQPRGAAGMWGNNVIMFTVSRFYFSWLNSFVTVSFPSLIRGWLLLHYVDFTYLYLALYRGFEISTTGPWNKKSNFMENQQRVL